MRRVIKIGTSTTITAKGQINQNRLATIAEGVAMLMEAGDNITLVTSGAVGAGRSLLNRGTDAPHTGRSAFAAIGQIALMTAYQSAFHPLAVAQILVDQSHVSMPSSAMALQATLHHLWNLGIVPLINENDALSGVDQRIGDNDTLAALVSSLIAADQLVILSDIDGLYTDNPATNPNATRISIIPRISLEHFGQFGDGSPGPLGSGGIISKLRAAHIAQGYGIETILAAGYDDTVWQRLRDQNYENLTRFAAQKEA